MNILVCLKQILDPDIPARDFRIDPERREAVRGSADLVTNIFCENALETALQLKDAHDGMITVLSHGSEEAEDVLRKALAMKADEAALVLDDDAAQADPLQAARVLAAAARKLGSFDVIMVGRESGDWGVGQTGGLLAEELGVPFIALVEHLDVDEGKLRIRRQTDTGTEIFEVTPPVVISITNSENNLPRIPKTRDVMKSYRKPLTTIAVADLSLTPSSDSYFRLVEISVPEKETRCELVEGHNLEQRIDAFAHRVAEIANTTR